MKKILKFLSLFEGYKVSCLKWVFIITQNLLFSMSYFHETCAFPWSSTGCLSHSHELMEYSAGMQRQYDK